MKESHLGMTRTYQKNSVIANFDFSCGFCTVSEQFLPNNALKTWATSNAGN